MSESYYAIEKFAEAERSLASIIEAMPIKRKAIDIYREKNNVQRAKDTFSELESIKRKLLDTVRETGLLFSECDIPDCSEYANKLYGAVKSFNLLTPDYTKLISAVTVLKNRIPKTETVDATLIGRLMNNVKMGYYPTDIAHVKMMKKALRFPENKVNLFDPCCGCGLALEALSLGTDSVTCSTF